MGWELHLMSMFKLKSSTLWKGVFGDEIVLRKSTTTTNHEIWWQKRVLGLSLALFHNPRGAASCYKATFEILYKDWLIHILLYNVPLVRIFSQVSPIRWKPQNPARLDTLQMHCKYRRHLKNPYKSTSAGLNTHIWILLCVNHAKCVLCPAESDWKQMKD